MDAFLTIDKCESSWSFEMETFMQSLLHRWPDAQIRQSSNTKKTTAYTWSLSISPGDAGLIEGFIARSGEHIGLKATPEMCIYFALWIRRLLPLQVKLYLGDDQHPEVSEVLVDDSAASLLRYFSS